MTMPDGTVPPPGGGPNASPPESQYAPLPSPAPAPPYYAPPAAPPAKRNRTGLYAFGVLVILIVLTVGGLALFRDRISGDVNQLQVGDCIDEPSSTSSITDVQHQPCTEPHDGEVFANLTYPGDNNASYPVLTTAFDDFVSTNCLPLAEQYTGRTQDEIGAAGYSYAYFYPTSSSWTENNDRGVTCYIEKADGTKMTGSVRSSSAAATPAH